MVEVRPHVRTIAMGCASLIALVGLVACTGDSDDAGPKPVADELAKGLSDGDVGGLTFDGTSGEKAQAQFEKTLSGMGDYRPKVTIDDVTEDGDTATATLGTTWEFEDPKADWSYETEAVLTRNGDEWVPQWDRSLVAPKLKQGEHLSLTGESPDRGAILDRSKRKIVKDRPVVRMGLDKTQVSDSRVEKSARQLAKLLDIDAGSYVADAKAAGPDAFVEAIVLRKADAADVDAGAYRRIKGATQISDTMSLAPTSDFGE
ncbi:MAG: penicillin-binding protein, partial [Actinomycetia bacterium]|nr:penicillin-binding protein [Actinomycetes bacterium]